MKKPEDTISFRFAERNDCALILRFNAGALNLESTF